ncbi:MAG: AmmeMemoRadiSam system radical SAM enzyme [Pseudomonadota bacterium]
MQHQTNDFPARYWKKCDDGQIECLVCPRRCKLCDGQRGLCFVRARKGDEMVLTTWGRSSGFCIDPIEKKPLSHFYPGSSVLSFGTAGCNLTCKFCQNHDISKSRQMDKLAFNATPEQIVKLALKENCKSLAYTYNDPVIFLEYAVDIARLARTHKIKNVAVTAGYITTQAREEFFSHMDAVNLDLKAFSHNFYHKLCSARLDDVLETARYIYHESDCWLELTTLLIPQENDSEKEITQMCDWILKHLGPDVPLHFTAFHPDFKMTDKPRTAPETLKMARTIALKAGIHYVYCGNIAESDVQTTYCPNCNKALIIRSWHDLLDWRLGQGGHCMDCGTVIAGFFDTQPGQWKGRKPVIPGVNTVKLQLPDGRIVEAQIQAGFKKRKPVVNK